MPTTNSADEYPTSGLTAMDMYQRACRDELYGHARVSVEQWEAIAERLESEIALAGPTVAHRGAPLPHGWNPRQATMRLQSVDCSARRDAKASADRREALETIATWVSLEMISAQAGSDAYDAIMVDRASPAATLASLRSEAV